MFRLKAKVYTLPGGNKEIHSYYSHSRAWQTETCFKNISVKIIEFSVFYAFHQLFCSLSNIEKAVKSAFTNTDKKKEETKIKLESH